MTPRSPAPVAKDGLDTGVLVLLDQRAAAAPVEERTREEAAETASGERIRVLRA